MREYLCLGEWILGKWKTQAAFAAEIGAKQGQVSRWISGVNEISEDYQKEIRKLGYKGPWPERKVQEAAQAPAGDFATREELWRLAGRVEGLEKRLETAFEQLRDLYLRGPKESRQGEPPR